MSTTPRQVDTLSYLGTIDDVVLRFPWSGIPIDKNFLRDTILEHVLFGTPMLINDGYLINHPLARADLVKGERSLILKLVEKGFIKVLTRRSDPDTLHLMPLEMADQQIESFSDRISSDEWPKLERALAQLGEKLRFHSNCYRWPPVDMGDGFRILIENALQGVAEKGWVSLGLSTPYSDHSCRTLDSIAQRLVKDSSGARNHFEHSVKRASITLPSSDQKVFVDGMMGLANEVYHFNFGIQLDHHLRKEGLAIVAETRLSRAFDDLLGVDERVLEFDGELPLMGMPDFLASEDPDVLSQIVDQSTEIGKAKQSFQKFMRQFAMGKYTLEEAEDFGKQYELALSRHFSIARSEEFLKRRVNIGVTISTALIGAGFPAAGAGIAAASAGLAGQAGLGVISSQVGEPRIMKVARRFMANRTAREFEDSRVKLSPHVTRSLLSTLRFEPNVTDKIALATKRFD